MNKKYNLQLFGVQKKSWVHPFTRQALEFSLHFCSSAASLSLKWGLILAWISLNIHTRGLCFAWVVQHMEFSLLKDFRTHQMLDLAFPKLGRNTVVLIQNVLICPDVFISKGKDSKQAHENTHFSPPCKCLSWFKPPLQLLWSHRL